MMCRLDTRANIRRRLRELGWVLRAIAIGAFGAVAFVGFLMLPPKWMAIAAGAVGVVLWLLIARWVFCVRKP